MQNLTVTPLTRDELENLIIDCVNACLRRHSAQAKPEAAPEPGQAAPPFVTKREAAALLSVSRATVDNWAKDGLLLRHYVGGKSVRFDRAEVLALAKKSVSARQVAALQKQNRHDNAKK